MKTHNIPFIDTGYFSELMCDYLNDKRNYSHFQWCPQL